ncbi:hypothetical protein GOV08_01725 [Candidatus Woesearchaeota archaeon]|nr:hypothetical protein [Candidatus Woesearchaeota archaeon]
MFRYKKAVSPLIATVLLIAFAVALGAVVMNWGKDYVETTAKDAGDKSNLELSCQRDIDLGVKEIGNTPKICYGSNYLEVMLENNGRTKIEGMRFIMFDSSDSINITDNSTLTISGGGVTNKLNITHDISSTLVQVEFIPMIKPKGSTTPQLCSKNSLVVTDLTSCS